MSQRSGTMKGGVSLVLSAVLLLAGWLALPAQAGAQNVAFVTMNRILEDSPQAEQAMRELEREFSPRDAELVAEREELQRMRDRLERDGDMMNPSERADLEREFSQRSREFRRAQESFSEDLNVRRNEELSRLQRRINDAIVELAREREIDVILTERNVLYASDRVDITDDILAAMQRDD
ncbi:OmpH family outer membrane protein [Thioalkalivibrio sp. ALgr1]|uniref:OmpH family outer membrane protein n=1 Tax=Thioalkalivibrio sp. ALgr1 TaxID=748655 RepID=UPI00036EF56D|nr:OmpH family outer membrane protein [Thioalkalivibrio sp. ALgr1]